MEDAVLRVNIGLLCTQIEGVERERSLGMPNIVPPPQATERTSVGVTGRDLIALRGYEVEDVKARNTSERQDPSQEAVNARGDGTLFSKYTMELRYPVSLNPSSTIYAHAFLQGGNMWYSLKEFNPFDVKRSAGVGVRVFLPMFGMLGFDYGIGFDKPWLDPTINSFTDYGRFSVILGFEPD